MTEQTAPYGSSAAANGPAAPKAVAPDPTSVPRKRIRTITLQQMKERGERWAMLTSYDTITAALFDEAGVQCLLIGDSAGNTVLGYDTTLPVTLDEMVILTRAVASGTRYALVVADLPFGSYQASPQQAYESATRLMKEGRAHAVKLEGGVHMAPTIKLLTDGGIPVIAHIGFTPQSEHALGGYRVQGRGDERAAQLVSDAKALEAAGAFAVLMEMVPAPVAEEVTRSLRVPTIGIGAGAGCDAQVLVWQDMLGLGSGRTPRFVKKYADLRSVISQGVRDYVAEVQDGTFPAPEHTFES